MKVYGGSALVRVEERGLRTWCTHAMPTETAHTHCYTMNSPRAPKPRRKAIGGCSPAYLHTVPREWHNGALRHEAILYARATRVPSSYIYKACLRLSLLVLLCQLQASCPRELFGLGFGLQQ